MMIQYLCKCKWQTQIKNENFWTNLKKFVNPISSFGSSSHATVDSSFTISYLKNTCGLTGKSLIRASNLISFESSDKRPDSVLKLFQSFGFTQTHITHIISRHPQYLLFSAQKTLKPKLDLLLSVTESDTEVIRIVSRNPFVLTRSVKNNLIPYLNMLNSLTGSRENTIAAIKCRPYILSCSCSTSFLQNVELLQTVGVPLSLILKIMNTFGQILGSRHYKLRKVVLKVKEMGFDPSSHSFINAVTAMVFVSASTWKLKTEIYISFGFSNDEIISMFKKLPTSMMMSVDKIRRAVDFFVNKLRWSPSRLSITPNYLVYSLEKRLIPRCSVLQVLASRNRINTSYMLTTILTITEKDFLENYVTKYMDEVPEAMDAYQGSHRKRTRRKKIEFFMDIDLRYHLVNMQRKKKMNQMDLLIVSLHNAGTMMDVEDDGDMNSPIIKNMLGLMFFIFIKNMLGLWF